ncbi:hypothetical protein ACFO4E_18360 [Nocardiopsis mangrovi]|uniref:Uncharacterized protein n=1 Tax=Nocardiopsis mangrovi TaxID=1179818 RepID=A0ABV9E1E2_9ACTN
MTPELLEEPTVAQVVLRVRALHEVVFAAALNALPGCPRHPDADSEDLDADMDRHLADFRAWEQMWRGILGAHPEAHWRIVEWADESPAESVIRHRLLEDLPWQVEDELLLALAVRDVLDFAWSVLIAKSARMRRDGLAASQVREKLSGELAQLPERRRERAEEFIRDEGTVLDFELRAPVHWVRGTASKRWRYLLDPDEATEYGRPRAWRASEATLAEIGRRFADVAVRAVEYWEADSKSLTWALDDIRWVRAMLLHLSEVTPEIKLAVSPIVAEARRRLERRSPWWGGYQGYEESRQATAMLDTIRRIVEDPVPQPAPDRRTPVGDPDKVTPKELAGLSGEVLTSYIDRHTGDDELVEKALLSLAIRGCPGAFFEDMLGRHTAPEEGLIRTTVDLRRRLGGGPSYREGWTRLVLALPDPRSELVRALPAWTALRAQRGGPRQAHPSVVSVVRDALGTDDKAWGRFAESPAKNTGPDAWYRLGDILDAAAQAAPWPKPPTRQ